MKTHVTLQERLKDLRNEKNISLQKLAEDTGLSSSALGEYENDENKGIPHYALVILAEYYSVSLDYLFDKTETRNYAHNEIADLNLTDDVIELLKSGVINNRLLGEMICHPEFRKFMADTEIFVDGIASQSIQSINAYADTLRKRIISEFNPDANDPGLLTLDACTIEEEKYFLSKLSVDLELIVKDIRKQHKSDKDTATDTTVADRVNEIFDEVKKNKNDLMLLLTMGFCKDLGISANSLSSLELETLHSIFARSKHYKQAMNSKKNKKKHK